MLDENESTTFEHDGIRRRLFLRGAGRGIVVMHEIPGIYPAVSEFAERRGALHISDADLARVRERVQNEGCKVLGLRFTDAPLCPPERFERLRKELGAGFERVEIDSSSGNPHGNPGSAHSVVTKDLIDRDGHPTRVALDRVLGFFAERLAS